MQEIHSIGGGRFFGGGGNGGGGGGGDRRLRPQHHHQQQQPLKCPRCDSINTKFCYYNNYNLSQPRHFCKNCRRYWTKGGVLRNVPVGGGCRKSKRANNNSATKSSNNNSSSETAPEHNSNSHSSSESSSLTATTTEAVSAPNNSDSMLLIPPLETGSLEQQGTVDCAIFSEIGSFTSLINSTNDTLQFGFDSNTIPDTSSFQWQHQKGFPDTLNGGDASSLLDQGTVAVDLSALQNKTGLGGFGSLDWNGGADQGLFDLSNTVDHGYWNPHTTHWSDHDNSNLFHLP